MGSSKILALTALSFCSSVGCMHHDATVRTASLPAPSASPVQHTSKLWVELGDATWEHQCRSPQGLREVCFSGMRRAAFGALERGLWSSFPDVLLREGDAMAPGDYLLKLDVTVDAVPPDAAERLGWSALATGAFELSRDGRVLRSERLGSRSRGDFAYGSALGAAAGEVVDALAVHVAEVLGAIPETRPLAPTPLPAVMAEVLLPSTGPTPAPPAPSNVDSAPAPTPTTPSIDPSVVPEPAATSATDPTPAPATDPTPVAAR